MSSIQTSDKRNNQLVTSHRRIYLFLAISVFSLILLQAKAEENQQKGGKTEKQAATADNLLKNGGFEEVAENATLPDGWKESSLQKRTATFSKTARNGKYALELPTMFEKAAQNSTMACQKVTVPTTGSHTFTLTGYIKTIAGGRSFCSCVVLDENKKRLGKVYSKPLKNKKDWTPFTWTFSVVPKARYLLISLRNSGGKKPGTVWYDDITLVQAPQK